MKNCVIFWYLGKAITLALLVAAGAASVHADEPQSTIPEYRYDKSDPKGGKAHYVRFRLNDDGTYSNLLTDVFDEEPKDGYDYVWYEDIVGSEHQTRQEYTGGGIIMAIHTEMLRVVRLSASAMLMMRLPM